jgi:hypothetical protein
MGQDVSDRRHGRRGRGLRRRLGRLLVR